MDENGMGSATAAGGAILVVSLIWAVVGIGYLVWYLWSMSRLLERLGMPKWYGWVPVWNEWQMMNRGGYPGWIILLSGLPVANLVAAVFRIMAVHRINTEFGKGVGYTVMGALIPPLWATMLSGEMDQGRAMPSAHQGANHTAPQYGQSGFAPAGQQPYAAAVAGAPAQAAAPAQNNPFAPPPVPNAPAQEWQAEVPAAPQSFAPPQVQPEQAGPAGPVPPWQQMAPPQAPQAAAAPAAGGILAPPPSAASQYGAPSAPAGQPAAEPTAWEKLVGAPPEVAPGYPAIQAAQPADALQPGHHVDPTPTNTWGLSSTTEREFERLAAEGVQAPPSTPLSPTVPHQSFEWPVNPGGALGAPEDRLPAVPPEVLAPLVLPETPAAPAVPPPAAPQPVAPAEPFPADAAIAPAAAPAPAGSPAPTAAPAPAETSIFDNAPPIHPAASSTQDAPQESLETSLEELFDLDETVVAPRFTRQRWGLALTDGQVVELPGTDIVIGRKPESVDGAAPVQIPDPTRTLSKTHARLRFDGEKWSIEDLGSTNGVALVHADGTEIDIDAGRPVDATQQLIIGTLEVRLQRIEEK